MTDDAIHDVIYHMDLKNHAEGEILQRPGDKIKSLYFITDGIVEVSADFDDHNFVIERLHRGSIINYRNWFNDEGDAMVYIKFHTACVVQELPLEVMNRVCLQHKKDLEVKFLRFQSDIAKVGLSYPLDYIMNLPRELRNRNLTSHD